MNKKMIMGIIIVAGIAMGLLAMHTPIKLVNASTLEVSGGSNTADGPHPTQPDSWQIMASIETLDGPHPTQPDSW